MPLSKESRNLGQKAAAISATAFALKSLGVGVDKANAPAFMEIIGAENAAAVAGITSVLVTIYFLLRVWDEHLAISYEMLVKRRQPGSREDVEDGEKLEANVTLQPMIKSVIAFADFWLPLGLGVSVAALLSRDILNLATDWHQHLIN